MLVLPAFSTSRKMAPKPRVPAELAVPAMLKLSPMLRSSNCPGVWSCIAKVFFGLKARNWPALAEFTLLKPSPLTA